METPLETIKKRFRENLRDADGDEVAILRSVQALLAESGDTATLRPALAALSDAVDDVVEHRTRAELKKDVAEGLDLGGGVLGTGTVPIEDEDPDVIRGGGIFGDDVLLGHQEHANVAARGSVSRGGVLGEGAVILDGTEPKSDPAQRRAEHLARARAKAEAKEDGTVQTLVQCVTALALAMQGQNENMAALQRLFGGLLERHERAMECLLRAEQRLAKLEAKSE